MSLLKQVRFHQKHSLRSVAMAQDAIVPFTIPVDLQAHKKLHPVHAAVTVSLLSDCDSGGPGQGGDPGRTPVAPPARVGFAVLFSRAQCTAVGK